MKTSESYEIRVEDHLESSNWSYWFQGLTIRHEANGQTVLSGAIPDQAALHGVLARVRDLSLKLISVTRIEPEAQEQVQMLGNMVELCVAVRNLDEAIERYTSLFGLAVAHRGTRPEMGYESAVLPLPTRTGFIELLQPTDPNGALGRFLERRGEGVYLVGFEVDDLPTAIQHLQRKQVKVTRVRPDAPEVYVHPSAAHGVFILLRKRAS